MNNLILCEGTTDAILIGVYLERTCHWESVKSTPGGKPIFAGLKRNQYAHWYKRGKDYLLVFAVGGKDNFSNGIDTYILPILREYPHEDIFHRIAIVCDRDKSDEKDILLHHEKYFQEIKIKAENNRWTSSSFSNSFGEQTDIMTLSVIIPTDKQGALETVLLEALSEDTYDKVIVNKSKSFIDYIKPSAKKYISTDRLIPKAYLSVVFAVMSPEMVFGTIGRLLKEVHWEKSTTLRECFNELCKI